MGADRTPEVPGAADLCFETSGDPEGLGLALAHARREVHLKSTHGRPGSVLPDPTAFVVSEQRLLPWDGGALPAGEYAFEGPSDWRERIRREGDSLPPLASIRLRSWKGPILSSSRCGDFRRALALLEEDATTRRRLGSLSSIVLPARDLPRAFELAASGGVVKVFVVQEGADLS